MNILFIGDIVGKEGRRVVEQQIRLLKQAYAIDFVIANGENAAHGKGLTPKVYQELLNSGIDVITLGNHTFSKRDIYQILGDTQLVRPINLLPKEGGKGIRVYDIGEKRIAVANICGCVFMNSIAETPYDAAKQLIETKADIKIVDLHAETTSEKILFCQLYRNDFTAVLGTHTHVQTADESIWDGCAFISDVGMCGPYESILGRDIDEVLSKVVDGKETRFTIAEGEAIFCAVLLQIDSSTNRAIEIERIQIRPKLK